MLNSKDASDEARTAAPAVTQRRFTQMPFINGGHIWLIAILLIIVLIIWGPGKLPDVGAGMGRAIREFRKASAETREEFSKATRAEPAEPATPVTTPMPLTTPVTVAQPAPVGGSTAPEAPGGGEGDSTSTS
jgi:sec-independent protein translocase protein TatA